MSLRKSVIRLAYDNRNLRPHLIPLLRESGSRGDRDVENLSKENLNKNMEKVAKYFRSKYGLKVEYWDYTEPLELSIHHPSNRYLRLEMTADNVLHSKLTVGVFDTGKMKKGENLAIDTNPKKIIHVLESYADDWGFI